MRRSSDAVRTAVEDDPLITAMSAQVIQASACIHRYLAQCMHVRRGSLFFLSELKVVHPAVTFTSQPWR